MISIPGPCQRPRPLSLPEDLLLTSSAQFPQEARRHGRHEAVSARRGRWAAAVGAHTPGPFPGCHPFTDTSFAPSLVAHHSLMSDYQVTLVNNKMNEFFVKFYGPAESESCYTGYEVERVLCLCPPRIPQSAHPTVNLHLPCSRDSKSWWRGGRPMSEMLPMYGVPEASSVTTTTLDANPNAQLPLQRACGRSMSSSPSSSLTSPRALGL